MSLAPLLDAAPAIPLHAFAAMTAFLLGVVQLAAPKGTLPHRTLGWVWISLMVDPPDPADRSMEPDSSAVDLHAGRAPDRSMDGAPSPRRRSPPHHDPDFLRCACHRRAVHLRPGADHAHGAVRPIATLRESFRPVVCGSWKRAWKGLPGAGFPGRREGCC